MTYLTQAPGFGDLFARLTALILTLLSFLTPAKPQNVALAVQTATPETVTVAYKNNTGRVISPEQSWLLERKTEIGFETIPFAEDFPGWPEIAERCPPTRGGTRTIDAARCFGRPLSPGEYRFTLCYVCETASGLAVGEPQSVSIVFSIPAA